MKRAMAVVVALCLLGATTHAADSEQERLHRANVTMWTGVALAVGGLILLPVTVVGKTERDASPELLGLGITVVGTVLIWRGAQDRRKAVSPQTTVAVFTGRSTGVQVRRVW
jgi:hypothetical protein